MSVSSVGRPNNSNKCYLLSLPNELLHLISNHLGAKEVTRMITTCRCLFAVLDTYLYRRIAVIPTTGYNNDLTRCVLKASEGNKPDILSKLLALGANFGLYKGYYSGYHYHGYTSYPLRRAAELGHVSIVELLISGGMPINLGEGEYCGASALMGAIRQNQIEVIRLLISHRANLVPYGPYRHNLPLAIAASHGFKDAVELLLHKLKAGDYPSKTIRSHCREAFYISLCHGYFEILKFLLDGGLDPNFARGHSSMLYHAVNRSRGPIVELLLKHGATARDNDPLLMMACRNKSFDVAEILLKAKLSRKYLKWELEWAIHMAETADRADVAKLVRQLLRRQSRMKNQK
ncbi:ankyrin repeat-containing domain protein [Talaromyces proteolyticus]|uniref:Ankyrin repeat-containing domain protein n=1 Tax=Talaromyces proteolyticus TaxID=1131652 RepID=A0AAD4KXG0_9EURO|nr:ankyrin repeat-containing domain protein [Talaromyces proteolyticus]KAH8700982.1 ankyrin repeat-containing domain protein [Talaromyces proteolyticus]